MKYLLALTIALPLLAYLSSRSGSEQPTITLGNTIQINHWTGVPHVLVPLKFDNSTSVSTRFSNIRANLKAPNGSSYDMSFEAMANSENNSLPYFGSISLSQNASERYKFAFIGEHSALNDVHMKIQKDLMPNQHKIFEDWHPNKNVIAENDLETLSKLANQSFVWVEGRWQISITYASGPDFQTTKGFFNITNADIKKMRSAFSYYGSGLGVFPNWRFLNTSNQPSGVDLHLEISK